MIFGWKPTVFADEVLPCTWIFPLTTRSDGKRTRGISTTHNPPPYFVNTLFSLAIPLGFMAVLPPFYHLSRCRAGTARPVRVPCTAAASPATRTVWMWMAWWTMAARRRCGDVESWKSPWAFGWVKWATHLKYCWIFHGKSIPKPYKLRLFPILI